MHTHTHTHTHTSTSWLYVHAVSYVVTHFFLSYQSLTTVLFKSYIQRTVLILKLNVCYKLIMKVYDSVVVSESHV